jgi:CRP-like cAMP-binding protein
MAKALGRGMSMARLANIHLFKGLDLDLSPFEARSNWRRFDPEEVIVDFDELSTDVYFLLSGEVRVLMRTASGKEIILNEMKPGRCSANWRRSTASSAPPT